MLGGRSIGRIYPEQCLPLAMNPTSTSDVSREWPCGIVGIVRALIAPEIEPLCASPVDDRRRPICHSAASTGGAPAQRRRSPQRRGPENNRRAGSGTALRRLTRLDRHLTAAGSSRLDPRKRAKARRPLTRSPRNTRNRRMPTPRHRHGHAPLAFPPRKPGRVARPPPTTAHVVAGVHKHVL